MHDADTLTNIQAHDLRNHALSSLNPVLLLSVLQYSETTFSLYLMLSSFPENQLPSGCINGKKKLYHFAKQECELRVHGKLKCEEEKISLSPPRARLFAFRYPPPYPAIAVILSCFDIQPASPRSKEEYSEERQLECGSWLRRTQFEWMKQDFFFFFLLSL